MELDTCLLNTLVLAEVRYGVLEDDSMVLPINRMRPNLLDCYLNSISMAGNIFLRLHLTLTSIANSKSLAFWEMRLL